jgi:glucose/arabinose dehydrogenase
MHAFALASFTLFAPAACGVPAVVATDEPYLVQFRPEVVEVATPPQVHLVPAFGGKTFQRPVDAQPWPDDERSWVVVEQRGIAWRLTPGIIGWVRTPLLDVSRKTSRAGNEEGLLGLAFSPHFATSGHPHEGAFYVNYSTKPGPRSRLSRYFLRQGKGEADRSSEQVLLEVDQPYRNHNGGGLRFGPNGMLYYSLGDGGSRADPMGNGQDPSTLLGSILRIDVGRRHGGLPYAIPADNPFVGHETARPEVWAYGLRNAWRFSFDRQTGELWAGDVGQDKYEFIHRVQRGGNHGWNLVEGFHDFEPPADGRRPELIPPVFEYEHPEGLSITGGFVYRGSAIPDLVGWYVYADYLTRMIWAIRLLEDGRVEHAVLLEDAALVTSFAEGHDGELLVIDQHGKLYWLMAGPAPEAVDEEESDG